MAIRNTIKMTMAFAVMAMVLSPVAQALEIVPVTGITGHDGGNWPATLGHLSDMVNGSDPSIIVTNDTDPGMQTETDPEVPEVIIDPNDPSTWLYSPSGWSNEYKANSRLDLLTSSNAKIGWVVFDFGSSITNLESMYLWNCRWQNNTENLDTYNLYYSDSPTTTLPAMPNSKATTGDYDFASGGWTQLGGTQALPQNPSNNNTPQGIVAMGGIDARYIGMEILTTGSMAETTKRIGLAQVEFTRDPMIFDPNVNGDAIYDDLDLQIILSDFVAGGEGGGPEYNQANLDSLLTVFGDSVPASASSVPEPASMVLLLFGALGLMGLRRRK